ncbi:5-oxoprolinase subunit PxpB [Subsaximicrobium wynnwilliamsii]|uniref:5-oxoprolinase subunit PxpB n=1 Tax=Subsaximicrobium wynnwilliamsii TaxID=291179 RepID=A0A5C6ZKV9_9FLAO|nr:5-oxoprolinase subunit PxpB [Subsaximicrobium wynnwilliamsii]TXD84187.1 5-oxoprolinase subunit PxpB [Subsaximicrobium wynnwilliamsii]TXD89808.1 5-oxoprolinase subunit PxpB [Subsaximicrobium wynnwilliamsii]TXE03899.1 5-oxoprolinase subunit PxpB [Subsaximicrobium wynnwilliamsii]
MEKTDFKLIYKRFTERSILVQWPPKINRIILEDVLNFKNELLKNNAKQILQVANAYNSILITYHVTIDNLNTEVSALKQIYEACVSTEKGDTKLWNIPVCYHEHFGLDLAEISELKKLSIADIIKRHSEAIYTVYFIGFLPGFLYLGGLEEQLHVPRKSKPRQRIEKGAVAIGGSQTGIYPNASPAGWNVIGNCPLELFDVNKEPPCFARAGDQVRFYPTDLDEHAKISEAIKNGSYNLEFENSDD